MRADARSARTTTGHTMPRPASSPERSGPAARRGARARCAARSAGAGAGWAPSGEAGAACRTGAQAGMQKQGGGGRTQGRTWPLSTPSSPCLGPLSAQRTPAGERGRQGAGGVLVRQVQPWPGDALSRLHRHQAAARTQRLRTACMGREGAHLAGTCPGRRAGAPQTRGGPGTGR